MKNIFIFGLMVLLVGACGPQKTTQEQEDDQIRNNVEATEATLRPLSGTYRGFLKNVPFPEKESELPELVKNLSADERTLPVILTLTVVRKPMANAGRSKVTMVPTIFGTLLVFGPSWDGRSLDKPVESLKFSEGGFDETQNQLYLYGTTSYASGGGGAAGTNQFYFSGKFDGSKVVGRFSTQLRGYPGIISVNRVEE